MLQGRLEYGLTVPRMLLVGHCDDIRCDGAVLGGYPLGGVAKICQVFSSIQPLKVVKSVRIRPVACFARLMKLLLRSGQRSQEDAEDLIQDALLRLEQYRQKAEVRSEEDFLIRTVTNLAINEYHRHSRVLYEDEPVEELANRLALADPRAGPERQLAAQQELEEIKRVLDASSPRTRQIYFAHRSGYTYRDIAVVTGVSERTVEKHIARAVYLLMQAKESL